jgi:hypothetical protein
MFGLSISSRLSNRLLLALWLPLTPPAWAEEPAAPARAPTAAETVGVPDAAPLAQTFDLRGARVREVIRTTLSTQASSDYRIEPAAELTQQQKLVAALEQDPPMVHKKAATAAPRLPDRPPPCDGFISCGIETLLGLEDFDDETYGRVERNRLMNQGSFNDRSSINASVALPMTNAQAQVAGAPLKP